VKTGRNCITISRSAGTGVAALCGSGAVRIASFLFCALLLTTLAACSEANIDDSVVLIEVDGGSGSGFVVAPGGYVATNHHVIATEGPEYKGIVVYRDGTDRRAYRADVVWFSEELDLAILQIPGLHAPALPINDSELEKEDQVRAAGFPAASNAVDQGRDAVLISTRTGGQVSRYFRADWKNVGRQVKVVQHTAAINSGSSGGPLINPCDEVVGINTFVARSHLERDGDNIGVSVKHGTFFASHASELASILRVRSIPADIRSRRCGDGFLSSSMTTAAISAGVAFMLGIAAWYLFRFQTAGGPGLPWFADGRVAAGPARGKTRINQPAVRWALRGQLPDTGAPVSLSLDESRIGAAGAIILGRDPAFCELVVSHATVSSRGHAKFFRSGDRLMVADLRSTNGTSADGVRLGAAGAPDAAPLRDGMKLAVGAVHLTVSRIQAG
jgi:hypothetical protein